MKQNAKQGKRTEKPEKQTPGFPAAPRSSGKAPSQGSLAGSSSVGNVTFNNNRSSVNVIQRKKSSKTKDLATPTLEQRTRSLGKMGKVKLPSSQPMKDRKMQTVALDQSAKKESAEKSAKRGSQSRSRDRKSRSQSKKRERMYEKQQQQELRKQIAMKEAQLAKMTETAQKLRQKIQSSQPAGKRGSENFSPNEGKETIINNIQTISGDSKRDSLQAQAPSGAQVSKREREILRGPGKGSVRSPQDGAAGKSPALGGGIRSRDRHPSPALEGVPSQATGQKAYGSVNSSVPLRQTSPLRQRSYGTGNTAPRTEYTSLQAVASQPYGTYQTMENFDSLNRPPIDVYRQQTIDVGKSSPLRKNSRSRSPPRYDHVPVRGTRVSEHYSRPLNDDLRVSAVEQLNSKLRDQISTITSEVHSLRRRLDVVQQERSRAYQERDSLRGRLNDAQYEVRRLENTLGNDKVMAKQSQLVKDEIQWQRDANTNTQKEIDRADQQTKEVQIQITSIRNDCQSTKLKNQDNSVTLVTQADRVDVLTQKKVAVLRDIHLLGQQYDELKQEEHLLSVDVLELETRISRLQGERNQLIEELDYNQNKNNTESRGLDMRKAQLLNESKIQTKFMTAKIFANMTLGFHQARLAEAFKEIKTYSQFDQDCSNRLKALSVVLRRLAEQKQQAALNTWYNNALKPYDILAQNAGILAKMHAKNVKLQCFNVLRNHQLARMQEYISKNDGARLVWERLCLSRKKELARVLNIWKAVNQHRTNKIRRVRDLILKQYKQKLHRVLILWKTISMEVELECRTILMKRQYIERTYMASVFSAFKEGILHTKQARLLRQGVIFDAWRQFIQSKRHTLSQNLSILNFQKANQLYIVRVCFNALLHNKEKRATKVITIALRENMDVALRDHQAVTDDIKRVMSTKCTKRACQMFSNCQASKLQSYMTHWKEYTKYKRSKQASSFVDGVFRMYRGLLMDAFTKWKGQARRKKKRMMRTKIESLEQVGSGMEQESIQCKQERQKEGFVRAGRSGHKLSKSMRKFILRWQGVGLYKWRERVRQMGYMKERNDSIHSKMRKRLLGEAFERYKQFYLKSKQHDRNLVSADHLTYTLNIRTMRRCFNAYCAFVQRQRRAKGYAGRILTRMDLWMKRRAVVTWRANGNIKFSFELNEKQMQTVKAINDLTKTKGDLDRGYNEDLKRLGDLEIGRRRKAHKQLGNFMVRHSGSTLSKSFSKWKLIARSSTKRQRLLASLVNHWRKHQFQHVRNSMKTWMSNCKAKTMRDSRRQVLIEQGEQEQSVAHSQQQLKLKRSETRASLTKLQDRQQFKKGRTNHVIGVITRRNLEQDFYSKKRLIFCTWRHCVKQQKAFLICTRTVLEKSMYMMGFLEIMEVARTKRRNEKVYNLCHKFFRTFGQNQLADFFARWKESNLFKVTEQYEHKKSSRKKAVMQMKSKVGKIKDQQTACVEDYIVKRWKKKIWTAWVQRNFNQDQLQTKNNEAVEILKSVQTKRALQKWFHRAETTKRIRKNFEVMQANKRYRLKVVVWEALSFRRGAAQDITQTLSNLERLMRTKAYQDSFNIVRAYTRSKDHASKILKTRAAHDIASRLSYIHDTSLKGYFTRYKLIVLQKRMRAQHAMKIMLKIDNVNLREGFNRWATYMKNEVFCQEMNEVGPQTEHVFEATRLMHNLVEFMRDEHYTEEEIAAMQKRARDHNLHLMHKTILRLRAGKAKKAAIMLLEHWKMMIAVKKMFKYYIEFGNAQATYGKCDMRWAFNKWKVSDETVAGSLRRKRYRLLTDLNNQQTKVLEKQATQEAECSTIINHLNLQRDELLDKFIKAQQLALSALVQNHTRSKGKAMNRWKQEVFEQRRQEANQSIRHGVETIAEVKERAKRTEAENEQLGRENDELRRFSMDGFVIAKNVQQLSEDREKLSVDLADKTEQIKELLIQNRKLRDALAKLGYEPDEAVHTKARVNAARIKSQSPMRQ